MEKSPRAGAKTRKTVVLTVQYIVNIILGILFISPLIWMFITSLNPIQALGSQITSIKEFLPKTLSVSNFKAVFTRIPKLRYLFADAARLSCL